MSLTPKEVEKLPLWARVFYFTSEAQRPKTTADDHEIWEAHHEPILRLCEALSAALETKESLLKELSRAHDTNLSLAQRVENAEALKAKAAAELASLKAVDREISADARIEITKLRAELAASFEEAKRYKSALCDANAELASMKARAGTRQPDDESHS
jgi:hypothetical protein